MIDGLMFGVKLQVVKSLVQEGDTLDVGCGDKSYTVHLPNPVGIDAYEDCDHIKAEPDIWMDARELRFPDTFFDNVCFFDTLEHIPEADVAISEAWRVLREGGILAITDPSDAGLFWARILCLRWRQAFRGRRTPHREGENSPGHVHKFTTKSLKNLCEGKFILEKKVPRGIFTGYRFRKVS